MSEPRLTPRELQTLALAAAGNTTDEIAQALGITYETAKTYVRHFIHKLGARNAKHAIALAFRAGILR